MYSRDGYWMERGKLYYWEKRLLAQYYKDQEHLFLVVARMLAPLRVIELGCGYGRITRAMAKEMLATQFLGMDLSPDQIRNAGKYCQGIGNVRFGVGDACAVDFGFGAELYDLAVCAEFFLHLTDDELKVLVPKIMHSCTALIHEDWKPEEVTAEHCEYHDYRELYRGMGLRTWNLDDNGQRLWIVRKW